MTTDPFTKYLPQHKNTDRHVSYQWTPQDNLSNTT